MHCSQFFFGQKEQSSSSQFRTAASPFDFVDIPDAPEESDILGSFTDSLVEFQPSQIFQSISHGPKTKLFNSHHKSLVNLHSGETVKRKFSIPLELEKSDFNSLGKLRKSNEDFSKIHTLESPSQQYSEAGVEQQQDTAASGYQHRITKETPKLTPGTRQDIRDFQAEGKNHFYRNKSDGVYTPASLVLPRQNTVGIQLKSVEELRILIPNFKPTEIYSANQYRNIFDFPYFNIVQSRVFEEVFYTDKPLVVCAPTGAGKTVIFELGIIRLLMKMGRNVNNIFKVVYMAPIKALCSERFQDWQTKFGEFGLKCMELTGDTDIQDYFELQNVNIIFTTPEKWDSMTRRWRDNTFVIQSVCLFFIDEIHVLNDNTRGATIEAVVSRMKTIQASVGRSSVGLTLPKLRFIAVSATIPNIEDIAEWLGEIDKTKATFFKMDESLRPVRLRKVVLGFPFDEQKGSDFHFDMSLSYKLSGIINTYSDRKPCLVFCSTRKSTQQAAEILSRDSRGSYVRNSEMKQTLQKYCNLIKDGKLRDLVLKGIGFHHAGMDLQDRKMIEELFSTGQLQVLVATSTLAMGVNLPAHLVILKSTQHYNMGAVEEYSDTQVLQMIGRAGRPQFDTTATAVIMTKIKNKMKYESLLNGTQMIESSLHKHLIEHLNAEIVLHTINDLSIAMEWIRHTFLYIRVMKNPKHYSMPLGLSREQIETRLQDLCMRNLNQLASVNLVTMDGETFDVKPTEPGKLMARYCIAFETMKKFCSVPGAESIENLVKMIAESEEFTEIQLRVNEKKLLNTLNKDKNRTTIRYPIQGKIKTKQMKVNCLIQAQLGSLLVQDFSLQQDTTRIFRAAQRLVRCLVELLWTKPDYTSFFHALQLCKCIKAKLWEDSKHVTKQLDGIGPTLSNALANAGVTSFQKVEETNPRELELIVNRHPPFGNQVRASVASLPKYELTIEQVSQYSNARSEVILYLSIANQDKLLEIQKPTALNHTCVMLVGDQDNTILFRRRIMDSYLLKEHRFTRKLEVHKASSGPDLYFHFISQDWVGLDVQSTYTPFYLGAKTVSNRLPACNQTKRSSEVPRRQVSHVKTETTAEQRGCNHRCANKSVCRHKCCNTGTTVSKRPPPTTSGAGSRSCGKTISNYVCDLKNKLNMLTPSAKKIKMTPLTESKPSLNIERFSYTPRASTLTRIPSESPVIGQVPEESHSNTDWLHLNLYQKCREDLMDEQERINEENELPDIDEHSPTPQPQGNNFYSPDNFGHFSLTPRCPNTGQHTVDRDTFEEVEYNTDNAMTTFQDLAATPPSWHQGNLQETATYIQRPQYQRKLFQSTGADNKARYRFKPRATLCVSDLLDSDDRRLSNSRQYNIENETSYRPLYADPSPSEYPDLNYHQVVQSHIEITPRVCCTDQQNPKVHRFGQVVAWSNSQKTTKTGSSDEDWSGSDHDLITAETCFSVNRKSEESIGNTAMVKKLDPVIVDEIDTKNKETATDHCGHAGVDRSEGFWVPRDCFCQNDKALVNKDDASETFNSIFDGIF